MTNTCYWFTPPECYIDTLAVPTDSQELKVLIFSHDCIDPVTKLPSRVTGPLRTDKYPRLAADSPQWNIISEVPLTISPSLACSNCQTHGFFTEDAWISVKA